MFSNLLIVETPGTQKVNNNNNKSLSLYIYRKEKHKVCANSQTST